MTLLQDIRFAVRNLRNSPGFTVVALLSLALGIGANTAIFSLIDQVLLMRLPVKEPDRLMLIQRGGAVWGRVEGPNTFSYGMYRDIRDSGIFEGVLAYYPSHLSLSVDGQTERVRGTLVSGNYFEVLGVPPALGRTFTPADDRAQGAHPVVILSHGYWMRRFAGSAGVLNQKVVLNGLPMTVIGVAAPGFKGADTGWSPDVLVPLMMKPQMTPSYNGLDERRSLFLSLIARLKHGVEPGQAQAGLNTFLKPIVEAEWKEVPIRSEDARREFLKQHFTVTPGSKGAPALREQVQKPLLVLMAMVGVMLLIACVNVANLLLARGASRQKEIAIRLAMGAGRGRIVRQLLVESVVLAGVGGLLGTLLASWLSGALLSLFPAEHPVHQLSAFSDLRVLAFTIAVSVLTGVLFGLVPAWQTTRPALAGTLKENGSAVSGSAQHVRIRKALVVAQVSLSLLLLISAGLFARSLTNLNSLDPGFRTADVVTFSVDPSLNGYSQERATQFLATLQARVAAVPGVRSASLGDALLLADNRSMWTIKVEGHQSKRGEDISPDVMWIGPGYFETLGMPRLAGRDFDERDMRGQPRVAIINENLARHFWKDQNPIGRRFGLGAGEQSVEVIGVVRDGKFTNLRDPERRRFYLPYGANEHLSSMTYYARTDRDAAALIDDVRRTVADMDAQMPVYSVRTLRLQLEESVFIDRIIAALSTSFGFVATLLAAIGLYGVMAYSVTRRTREIGIRVALGADRRTVVSLVMREVLLMAVIGIVIAVPAALVAGRIVQSMLYGLTPNDVTTIAAATGVTAAVALLAGYLPALRATRVDPMIALRWE